MEKKWYSASPMAKKASVGIFLVIEPVQAFFIWGMFFVPDQRKTYIISGLAFAVMQIPVIRSFILGIYYKVAFGPDGASRKYIGKAAKIFPWSMCRIEIRKRRYEGKNFFVILIGQNFPSERQLMRTGVRARQLEDFVFILYRREILDDILQYIPPERVIGIELVEGKDEKGKYLFREKR